MSDIEDYDEPNEQFYPDKYDYQEISENETSYVIQEICENTNVEITSLSHASNDFNNNNDCDSIKKDEIMLINSDGFKREPSGNDKFSDFCLTCDTKIYPMEKLTVDGKLYHKNCFRCSKCRTILSVTNFNLCNNFIYCKTHFMELFKIRGKYDDDRNIGNDVILQNEVVEEIPTTDTKGLLEKFRQLESEPAPFTGSTQRNTSLRYVQLNDDIIRSQDIQQDELPPPETAKAMVAKFKAMELKKNVPTPENVQHMQWKAKVNTTPNANIRLQGNSNEFNRESGDYMVSEELPEEGTTKNLLNKFQNLSNNQ